MSTQEVVLLEWSATKMGSPLLAASLIILGGLGVLVAVAIGATVTSLATILTYVGAALFLALGLDPVVSCCRRSGSPSWAPRDEVLALVKGLVQCVDLRRRPLLLVCVVRAHTARGPTAEEVCDRVQFPLPVFDLEVELTQAHDPVGPL
jgi:hypothetical protein